ncbi:hypothetical protein QRE66_11025 [Bacillus cereus]|uniref:hypothetical protein n=1 Tax=Bacillus pseudomycoides TaxID=64104 RepID=UPI001FB36870|nr:hypothetical protein [Bacillus pseudomycoides]WJE54708.1 hypothetical protein QRE66_11025 [Bacillus cereus]
MNAKQIQDKVEELHYWDSRVIELSSDYFADEITLAYDNSTSKVVYRFVGCYKSNFNHWISFEKEKPYRDLSLAQVPYFLQDVEISEIEQENKKLYSCKVLMPPMELEIWCTDIEVSEVMNSAQ